MKIFITLQLFATKRLAKIMIAETLDYVVKENIYFNQINDDHHHNISYITSKKTYTHSLSKQTMPRNVYRDGYIQHILYILYVPTLLQEKHEENGT